MRIGAAARELSPGYYCVTRNTEIVRFFDDPGQIKMKITLTPVRYSPVCGSWFLQVHRNNSFIRGVRRNVDESREAPTSATTAPTSATNAPSSAAAR